MPDRPTVWVHDQGWHTLKAAHARQDRSLQNTFYISSPFSRKTDRTTVPRACSTVLPVFREDRQDHSPQSTFYSSAPSSETTDMTTVPRARSTVLPPLQRSYNTAVAPWSNAARTAVGQHGGSFEDINLHPNHRTDYLRQSCARTQKKKQILHRSSKPQSVSDYDLRTRRRESVSVPLTISFQNENMRCR